MNVQAAIAAVRAESVERGALERATRGRVLASIERSPRRRVHAVLAAVIASMFGASAFAWYARAPHHAAAVPVVASEPAAVTTTEPVVAGNRVVAREPAVAIEPAVAEPELPVVAVPTVTRAAVTRDEPIDEPVPAPTAPTIAPEPDAELALYASAHQLHFQTHDMTAALAAWDRYLAAAPSGKLAPEARFNRLVALVRLSRWDEAQRALSSVDDGFRAADLVKLRAIVSSHLRR